VDFSRVNADRVESTRASTAAGQKAQVDLATFSQWVDAYAAQDARLADFYFQRFRPEFMPAVQVWVATRPLRNTSAPPTPFSMPQYKLASKAEAQSLLSEAEEASAEARQSNQRSNNYVRRRPLRRLAVLRRHQHQTVFEQPRREAPRSGHGEWGGFRRSSWLASNLASRALISFSSRAVSLSADAPRRPRARSTNTAAIEAVITARNPIPASITTPAITCPSACCGVTSP